ncbi:VRR-NUC domain-containing protein [Paraburkholderia adhaesiva]|uniref:VRR-NUC domain-containing protein n=1 Tax=Paraburkholderia adhaesiva TaxID=2883244 RepID=UPI001F348047|nr:VRR-NUC domain-containing protein [Paraburkholderia adhaesiva]
MATPMTPFDETVTITEDTRTYVRLPDQAMGYLEEKIRSAMWWPNTIFTVPKGDGLVGVSLLKQVAMSGAIRKDETDRQFHFPYKAEVSFDMRPYITSLGINAPRPFLSTTTDTGNPGRRHSQNPFPVLRLAGAVVRAVRGDVRRPDVIIVTNPDNRWPGRGDVDEDGKDQDPNLKRLVEVKFPGDTWGWNQEDDYVAIAGDPGHMTLLKVEGGDQRSKEVVEAAVLSAFLVLLAGKTRIRGRLRAPKPVPKPAFFEAWSALEAAADSAEGKVAALWDTTRQGVRQLSDETQAWLRKGAGWLFDEGRWAADFTGKEWQYVSSQGRILWRYTTEELIAGWRQIRRQTDLAAEQLRQINWGQVLITAVEGIATVALVVAGVVVVVVLAEALVCILAALVAIVVTVGGSVLIAELA